MLLPRLITSAILAALALYFVDAWRVVVRSPEPMGDLLMALGVLGMWSFAIGGVIGVLAWVGALVWRSLVHLWPTRPRTMRVLTGCLLALLTAPALLPFASSLLSGPRISQHAQIEVLRVVVPLLLLVAAACGFWSVGVCAERAARGGGRVVVFLVAGVGMAGAVLGDWWDATQMRGQYQAVHDAAAVLTVVFAMVGVSFLSVAVPVTTRWSGRVLAFGAMIGMLVLIARDPAPFERSVLRRTTVRGAKMLWARDALVGGPALRSPAVADPALLASRRHRRDRAVTALPELDRRLPNRDDWNLLWITVDTLRADRLSCYGYERRTSPRVDAFARNAALFESAWSQNPITHYSFQSMFYGRYPRATPLYLRRLGEVDPEKRATTLARHLRDRGFATATIPAIPVHGLDRAEYAILTRDFEFVNPGRSGDALDASTQTGLATRFIQHRGQQRWFLWLHYMDPHAPYAPSTDWGFGSSSSDRYDGEIRSVDQGIGRVLDALEARGFAGRTIVVINGDHGEALGDHDTDFHGSTLYEEQVHVPLIMRLPGLGPQRVKLPVENIDIMPTVLDALAIDHELEMQGDSLVGLLLDGDGFKDPPPPVALADIPPGMVGELSPMAANKLAVRHGMWKLIHSHATGDSELYDLAADPGERRDVAHKYPERVSDLLGVLQVLEEETRRTGTRMEAPGTPRERLERLLAEAPGARARVHLVARAAERGVEGIDEVLKGIFADPSYGLADRATLFPVAAPRLGMTIAESLRAALVQRDTWGLVRAAMDGIAGMKSPERAEAVRRLRQPLLAAIVAPGPIARPAAELLTHIGDPAGRAVLARATKSPDRRVAFAAGIALLRLGEDWRAPSLAVELEAFSRDGMLAAAALDAFAVRKSHVALPVVLELVKSPFLRHGTRELVVRYLKAVADESCLAVFVFLLQGWDPTAAAAVNEVLDILVGETRRGRLREAAREAVGAFELSTAGRSEDAIRAFVRVAELAGPEAGALFRVYAAREELRIGRLQPARALADSVVALPMAKPWHPAAQAVLDADGAAPQIEIVDVFPVVRRPVVMPTFSVAVGIRNIGKKTIPGGSWDRAVSVGLTWTDADGRPLDIPSQPRTLPENGLAPNAEAVLLISSDAPPAGTPARARATVYWRERPVGVEGANRSCPSWTWSRKRNDLDPTDLVFRGLELMRQWVPGPQFVEPELGPDGVVSYVATSWDSYLVSPGFLDRGRPVEVVLEYESVVAGPRKTVALQCWPFHDDDPDLPAPRMHRLDVEANARKRLSATFEPQDGKGLRRIRVHPGQFPDLFRIWEIRIRTL